MDPIALATAASLLVAIIAFGLAFATVPVRTQMRTRLDSVLSAAGGVSMESKGSEAALRIRRGMGLFRSIVSGAWMHKMERDLRLADSQLHPGDFLAIRCVVAVIGFAVPLLFLQGVLGIAAAAGVATAGFMVPQMWLNQRRDARGRKLEAQLPEALTMVANSLRAGFGLLQALSLAAEQLEHPVSTEFAQAVQETNVGSSVEEAFQALSDRNENYDLDMVVTAILVQRTAGGNLAEILQTVTETMRERVRIKGEINTLTAQQRLTGFVIALLPVGVGALFLVISPEYIKPLFTESMGRIMLGMSVFLEIIGVIVIRRILSIEV
jgi:tight adherence protein B